MFGFNLISSSIVVPCDLAIADKVSPDLIEYPAPDGAIGVGVGVGETGAGVGEALCAVGK
jgi:hypothetical protein